MTLEELKQVLLSNESELHKYSVLMIYNANADQPFDSIDEALAA